MSKMDYTIILFDTKNKSNTDNNEYNHFHYF